MSDNYFDECIKRMKEEGKRRDEAFARRMEEDRMRADRRPVSPTDRMLARARKERALRAKTASSQGSTGEASCSSGSATPPSAAARKRPPPVVIELDDSSEDEFEIVPEASPPTVETACHRTKRAHRGKAVGEEIIVLDETPSPSPPPRRIPLAVKSGKRGRSS